MESPLIVIRRGDKLKGHVVGELASYTKCEVLWETGNLEQINLIQNRDQYVVCLENSPEVDIVFNPDRLRDDFKNNPKLLFIDFLEKRRTNSGFVFAQEFVEEFTRTFSGVIDATDVASAWPATKRSWEKGKEVHLAKKAGKWSYKGLNTWVATFAKKPAIVDELAVGTDGKADNGPTVDAIIPAETNPFSHAYKRFTAQPLAAIAFWDQALNKKYGFEDLYVQLIADTTSSKDRDVLALLSYSVSEIESPEVENLGKGQQKLLEELLEVLGPKLHENKTEAIRNNPRVLSICLSVSEKFELRNLKAGAAFALCSLAKPSRRRKTNSAKLLTGALLDVSKNHLQLVAWEKKCLLDSLHSLEFANENGERERLTVDCLKIGVFNSKDMEIYQGLTLQALLRTTNTDFITKLLADAPEVIFEVVKDGIGMTIKPELLASLLMADTWFIDYVEKHGLLQMIQASVKALGDSASFQGKLLNDGSMESQRKSFGEQEAQREHTLAQLSKEIHDLNLEREKLQEKASSLKSQLQASLNNMDSQLKDLTQAIGVKLAKAISQLMAEVQRNSKNLSPEQLLGRLKAISAGVGIDSIGVPGDLVSFDPSIHGFESEVGTPGREVVIVASGYSWLVSGESHVLQKAIVRTSDL